MKIFHIAAALTLLLCLAVGGQAQPNEPLPACADLMNANLRVIGAEDALADGVVYCREIARDGVFTINPGALGSQRVIERGVLQAYDVFGMQGGTPVRLFDQPITICLQGVGDLIFLPAFASPRPQETPQSSRRGDYTCAQIGSAGTVALVSPIMV